MARVRGRAFCRAGVTVRRGQPPKRPRVASVHEVARPPIITYRGRHEFGQPPGELWNALEEVDQFQSWWSWLEEFRLEGDALAPGCVLHGVVAPPLPYRMRIRVELAECQPPHRIDAAVHGDLEGEATLEICDSGSGSRVDIAWTVEMMQRPMRMASRFAHPLLQWGHDVVVGVTVAGFRRRLESRQA
jgi:carbon monoxide dehydrogenase subunit G